MINNSPTEKIKKIMEDTREADQTNVEDVQPTNQQETDNGRPGIFFAQLIVIFPDTPQLFLQEESEKIGNDFAAFDKFVGEFMNVKAKVPESWFAAQEQKAYHAPQPELQQILDMYEGDPEAFFMKRREVTEGYKQNALRELKNDFRYIKVTVIKQAFQENNYLYIPTRRALQKMEPAQRGTKRPFKECRLLAEFDPTFVTEHTYRKIEDEVRAHKEAVAAARQQRFEQASAAGELMACPICDDEDNPSFLPEEMLPCPRGHYYCKICIAKLANQAVKLSRTPLKCMSLNCDQCFSVSTIRQVLPAKAYTDFWVASLNDELHRAEIEGLERCPRCPFAIPMGPIETGDKSIPINSVFDCQNPNCDAKKTCRLCKFPEHIPLRCNEVEHDGPARKRNIMEEAMSASMIRNCPNKKCEVATMKSDGCNHITCNKCNTHFCYLCRQTLNKKNPYGHFGEDRCKLHTNLEETHQQNLQQGIEEGRRRAEEEMPGVELKFDPTRGHDVKK
jgi:TRIAD3 protein (E3 ubiquitin-protein ligase RNF216)